MSGQGMPKNAEDAGLRIVLLERQANDSSDRLDALEAAVKELVRESERIQVGWRTIAGLFAGTGAVIAWVTDTVLTHAPWFN